jgi:uroporphyrinogen decarboxylase
MSETEFISDYRHMVDAVQNRRPVRLPLYEHIIDPQVMGRVLDVDMTVLEPNDGPDAFREHYTNQCRFWRRMTYDTVSFEGTVTDILPGHGAILGGRPGPIQNRKDFEQYPWDELPELYWKRWAPHFDALTQVMPDGMKAVGGVGNGVFEISEDLVGYEYLCLLSYDDPQLTAELYQKIGGLMVGLWSQTLERYGDLFAVCRMGDDLGFKNATLMAPTFIRGHIIPQYTRIVSLVREAGKPFLLHSCGKIFDVMDDLIATGINAKHSNEDQIAPFGEWIDRYNDRIALVGGIDLNLLVQEDRQTVYEEVIRQGTEFRNRARGYALGSGNSIPDYVPVENYLAMIEAAQEIRRRETPSMPPTDHGTTGAARK